MTGLELKLLRTRKRVKAKDLAARMDVRPGRVSQIEALAVVSAPAVTRYLAALATFPEVAESHGAPQEAIA